MNQGTLEEKNCNGVFPQGLAGNCSSPRGLFGDSLGLLDRSVGRMHTLLHELEIENDTLTIFSADNVRKRRSFLRFPCDYSAPSSPPFYDKVFHFLRAGRCTGGS